VFQITSAQSVYLRCIIFALVTMSLRGECLAASPGIAGDWETSGRHYGLQITPYGDLAFFNYLHRCPISWSKYLLNGKHIETIDAETHQRRSLHVISGSEIRDDTTGYVYRPVTTIVLSGNPPHC
jgi:hypothetical protein